MKFFMKIRNGARSQKGLKQNSNASAAAAYISGEKIKDENIGKTFCYTKDKDRILFSKLLLPENAPEEFKNPTKLWSAVEKEEKQKNSRVFRSFILSLPKEISAEARQEITEKFAKSLVNEGMCVQFAIHDEKNNNGNFHAHFICTTRLLKIEKGNEKDGYFQNKYSNNYVLDASGNKIPILDKHGKQKKERGTNKLLWQREKIEKTKWSSKEKLVEWKKRAEVFINEEYRKENLNLKVDSRSYKEQGKNFISGKHIGYKNKKDGEVQNLKREFNKIAEAHNQNLIEIENLKIQKEKLERQVNENERNKRIIRNYDIKRKQLTKVKLAEDKIEMSLLGLPVGSVANLRKRERATFENWDKLFLQRASRRGLQSTTENRPNNTLPSLQQDRIAPRKPQSETNRQQLAPQSVPDRSLVAFPVNSPAPSRLTKQKLESNNAEKNLKNRLDQIAKVYNDNVKMGKTKIKVDKKLAKIMHGVQDSFIAKANYGVVNANFRNNLKSNRDEFIKTHYSKECAKFLIELSKCRPIANGAVVDLGDPTFSDLEKLEIASGRGLDRE